MQTKADTVREGETGEQTMKLKPTTKEDTWDYEKMMVQVAVDTLRALTDTEIVETRDGYAVKLNPELMDGQVELTGDELKEQLDKLPALPGEWKRVADKENGVAV